MDRSNTKSLIYNYFKLLLRLLLKIVFNSYFFIYKTIHVEVMKGYLDPLYSIQRELRRGVGITVWKRRECSREKGKHRRSTINAVSFMEGETKKEWERERGRETKGKKDKER